MIQMSLFLKKNNKLFQYIGTSIYLKKKYEDNMCGSVEGFGRVRVVESN